ncbi:SDR family NAD(P)-dependent oxidoreductase [Pseudomonas benzenivorans]|uniref:SDR family NAD(P)-dependent oxidoreductase n=1 Tax=Pseudomonas benzenivorans TaxID=556533 RepID=A0ABY5HB15_9PSED|nr:SDR family NAD(P)-dependent oxidoreductase [Pseudomonas benzenivorans]UTW08196.1 SDR family NAD(P)-dependent oxidoreductase [Pseudomonas benzenivorans]
MGRRFNGKVAPITGGAGGYGLAAAELSAAHGRHVGIAGLRGSKGDHVAVHSCAAGREVVCAPLHLSETSKAAVTGHYVEAALGSTTVSVKPTGSFSAVPLLDATGVEWGRVLAVNANSMLSVTRAVQPALMGSGGASIASTSTLSAVAETAMALLHSTSKGAGHMPACAT